MSDSLTNPLETTAPRALHDANGKFAKGNPGGPGNPKAGEVQKHRAAMFAAARDDDAVVALDTLREIMSDKSGRAADRIVAAEKLLDRLIGKPLTYEVEGEEPQRFIRLFLAQTLNVAPAAESNRDISSDTSDAKNKPISKGIQVNGLGLENRPPSRSSTNKGK